MELLSRGAVLGRVGYMALVVGQELLPVDLVRVREERPSAPETDLLREVVLFDDSNPDEIKATPLEGARTPVWIFRPLPPIR
jgi:hypothetical protein